MVGTAQPGSHSTGVQLKLEIGSLTDDPVFDRVLRAPLHALYADGYSERILIIVDALDEALSYRGTNLVQILRRLGGLPRDCRFLVTTRDEKRVLNPLGEYPPLDLESEPKEQDSIRQYGYERLATFDQARRSRLAERIAEAADGQFLYANLVLKDISSDLALDFDPEKIHLPRGLAGFYRENFEREIKVDSALWYDRIRPILGLITVAQGAGLTRNQLQWITRKDIDQPLELLGQYLDGKRPGGPFHLFHKSLGDFILEEEGLIDPVEMHAAIADYYLSLGNGVPAWRKWDSYAFLHVPTHLSESAFRNMGGDPGQIEKLVNLVLTPEYQDEHKLVTSDLAALQLDLQRAVRVAASCDSEIGVTLVTEAALGLVAFRRHELLAHPLFDLARQGRPEEAMRRADLFDLTPEWRRAVRLIFSWLAAGVNPGEAIKMRDSLPQSEFESTLSSLINRVDYALGHGPMPVLDPLPLARDEFFTQALVENLGGGGANVELLSAELYISRGLRPPGEAGEPVGKFLAHQDGPWLVAFAAAHPPDGDRFLRQYLTIHTGYQYVHYRQASLWVLLGAVLRHPSQDWVREILPELAISAMSGSSSDFQDALPTAVLALKVLAEKAASREALNAFLKNALEQAVPLTGRGDSWGFHKRRLAAIAQAVSLIPGMDASIADVFKAVDALPYGFAGFQSPACLNLAEVLHICGEHQDSVKKALEHALEAAHNIQDESFCAQQTARVKAIHRFWEQGLDARSIEQQLLRDPASPEFATIHTIGEAYRYRRPGNTPIPNPIILQELADLYQQPVEEFIRLNQRLRGPSEILEQREEIKVPDPGFAAHIAALISSEALIMIGVPAHERIALIRRLVPIASTNITVLDTVLARLLLCAKPGKDALNRIDRIACSFLEPPPLTTKAALPS